MAKVSWLRTWKRQSALLSMSSWWRHDSTCIVSFIFIFFGWILRPKNLNVTTLPPDKIPGHLEVKGICKGLHPKVFSERSLQHYCMCVTLRWTGMVQLWVCKKGVFQTRALCGKSFTVANISRKVVACNNIYIYISWILYLDILKKLYFSALSP